MDSLVFDRGGEDEIDEEAQKIGDHGRKQREFGKLRGTPCALQIPSTEKNGDAGEGQAEDILLDERCCDQDPGKFVGIFGIDDKIWFADNTAIGNGGGRLDREGRVVAIAKQAIEEREGHEGNNQSTSQWRDIESRRHDGPMGCERDGIRPGRNVSSAWVDDVGTNWTRQWIYLRDLEYGRTKRTKVEKDEKYEGTKGRKVQSNVKHHAHSH
jgi:hypothetical protein